MTAPDTSIRHARPAGESTSPRTRLAIALRIGWMVTTVLVTQTMVCGMALAPIVLLGAYAIEVTQTAPIAQLLLLSAAILPAYAAFAMLLMLVSAAATRALGWHTPADLETRIADVEWPLLQWVRHMVAVQIVRVFAGTLFRGSPIWTAYLRLAGARLGRRVYVNSLSVNDYNLLEFGDGVVIGEHVHLSGHTVEHGMLKTGRVRLGRDVTVGVGAVVDIGVEAGDGCQIGALSVVPKHTRLDAGGIYGGIPAHRVEVGRRCRQRRSDRSQAAEA